MTDITALDAPTAPVAFVGRRWHLFGLVLRNSLFNLLTLGIYRFWAKTRLRRYFWHGVAIDGEALEYTGRPVELLIGFLIVLAVLVPLGIVYSGFGAFLAANDTVAASFLDFAYLGVLFVLTPYALYRARRYRLTRTLWRGVRCGQDGSPVRYAFLSIGLWLLNLITLGLAYPWMRTVLQRFRMNNTRFGNRHFKFDGTGGALFLFWLPVVVCVFGGTALVLLGLWEPFKFAFEHIELFEEDVLSVIPSEMFDRMQLSIGGALLVLAAILLFSYRVREFRYFASVTRLGEAEFRSQLRLVRVLLIGIGYYALLALMLLIVLVLVGAVAIGFETGTETASPVLSENQAAALGFATLLLYLVALPAVKYVAFYHPLVRHASGTLQVSNMDHVATIVQEVHDQPRYGEGLADALDADVGVF